jgi:hypothetical protein
MPTTATPPEQPLSQNRVAFTDNPHIVNSLPLPFESWSRLDNGDALRLYFDLASPDCTGVHATVRETPDTVAVELRCGELPEAVGRIRTRIVVPGSLDVPLASALGDRRVLAVS